MEHKISKQASRVLSASNPCNFVSVVSVWEIMIKRHAGKLLIKEDADTIVKTIGSQDMWRILPLEIGHVQALNEIARFSDHTDPFDRILIAQAHHERLRIVTADPHFSRYGIDVIW